MLALLCTAISACQRRSVPVPEGATPRTLKLWRHETDNTEMQAAFAAIRRFNHSQRQWHITFETLPQGGYTEAITAAALAGQLPCIFDMDQPTVPNFAWAGHIRPIDDLLSRKTLDGVLPGAKSSYRGRLYALGQFDVALALFARRSALDSAGVRTASMDAPYSAEELLQILRKLKSQRPDRFPLDINTVHDGEWIAYAFSPWIQSAGGDLIERTYYQRAEGVLNGSAALRAANWYQTLFELRLVEKQSTDDQALLQERTVFHYTGSWWAKRYFDAFEEDLVVLPPPDFGNGPRIGAGSWQWGISSSCKFPSGAATFIEFLMTPEEIAAMSMASGFMPVSDAAAALTLQYRPGGPWRVFYEYAKRYAVLRPETPGYPKISASFEKAFLDIRAGKSTQDALDDAVDAIEYDVRRNKGYGLAERR